MEERRSLSKRLIQGISGQALLRVVNALSTLALVPLMIGSWGVVGFGEWMVITSLASYISYSNFGLVTTAGNDLVMQAASGQRERARHTFQMVTNVALYVLIPLFLAIAIAASFVPFQTFMNLTVLRDQDAFLIILLSLAQVWLGTVRGIYSASLYAAGYYGLSYLIGGTAKLIEISAIAILLLFFSGHQISAAAAMCGASLLELIVVFGCSRRVSPWAVPNLRNFDLAWLRAQVKPTLGFGLGTFATQGILLNGPRVVLGAMLGGESVALYSVAVTAMRLLDQAVLLIAFPLEVEIARSTGQDNLKRAYELVVLGTQFAWLALIAGASFLLLFGPLIFHFWTHDRIAFDYSLMALLIVMSGCTQLGRISSHGLIGTNRMYGPSALMVPAALAAVALGALLTRQVGINGMVIGGILGEFAVAYIAIGALTRWLGQGPRAFLTHLLQFRGLAGYVSQLLTRLRRRSNPSRSLP